MDAAKRRATEGCRSARKQLVMKRIPPKRIALLSVLTTVVLLIALRTCLPCPIGGYWSCEQYQSRLLYYFHSGDILEYVEWQKTPIGGSTYVRERGNVWLIMPKDITLRREGEPLKVKVGWLFMTFIEPEGEYRGYRVLNPFRIRQIVNGKHPYQTWNSK